MYRRSWCVSWRDPMLTMIQPTRSKRTCTNQRIMRSQCCGLIKTSPSTYQDGAVCPPPPAIMLPRDNRMTRGDVMSCLPPPRAPRPQQEGGHPPHAAKVAPPQGRSTTAFFWGGVATALIKGIYLCNPPPPFPCSAGVPLEKTSYLAPTAVRFNSSADGTVLLLHRE